MSQTIKRVMLIGPGGAGKSVLARQLGEALKLPVIHLDKERWADDGSSASNEEWLAHMSRLAAEDEWVMDGNFGVMNMDERMERADVIVFLYLSRWVCLWRGIKRNARYQREARKNREDGCPGKIDREFLTWIWNFPKKQGPQILAKLENYPEKAVVLRTPGEVKGYVESVKASSFKKEYSERN